MALFKSTCEDSSRFPLIVTLSLVESLTVSNLFKIAIKGNASFRMDDNAVFSLVESIKKADILLVDLSLPYHRITGIRYAI